MREGYFILGSNLVPDDEFVDIVELVPVLVFLVDVPEQGLELRPPWNSHIQRLRRVEALLVEQVKIVLVAQITQKLTR